MKNINKFLCILIFFCFIICLNCTYAVSDNAVENDTLSVDYQSDDIYSDSVDVSSDDNHVDEKIENSSDVKIQDNNAKPSNVVKKASSTVKTTITAKDVTKYYQDGTTLKAYLKNSNGKALTGKKITVTYSGKTYSRTTDSKGCVSWNVQKGPGTYSVKFSFSASGYASSSKTAKVTVKAMPTTLTANNLAFTYGDGNNKLKATLKDKNGKVLADKTVVFNFNGKNYNQKTDSKGVATLTIGAGPKKYTTTISFTNSNYVTSKKTVTVTVNSIPTSLTVNDLTCNYDDSNTYLYATLKDAKNNKFLSGQTITFKINDKSTNVVSDSNGRAGIKIEEKPGTYNVEVSFAKSPYASVSKTINLNVQGALTPEINMHGGFYNTSSLLVDFTGDNAEYIVYCSFDNGASWYKDNHNLSFNLTTGNWSITYYSSFRGFNSTINHVNYVLDGDAPLVWASHGSGIYNNKFQVNLTSVDLFDETPTIYYTLDGSDPTVQSNIYSQPINVVKNTNLRFFAIDRFNHKSEIISVYYFIGNCIANLNNGKTYTTIQNAINDDKTKKGDVIEVNKNIIIENVVINKNIYLISNNVIWQSNNNSPIIYIKNVNNTFIEGFTFKSDNGPGIVLNNVSNCVIQNNNFYNKHGFSIYDENKDNDNLNNICIQRNNFYDNHNNYISFHILENSKIIYNKFESNKNVSAITILNSKSNIITNNQFTNLNYGILINNSNDDVFFGNNFSKNNIGLYLNCVDSKVISNTFIDNHYGIYSIDSSNLRINFNRIVDNSKFGVYCKNGIVDANNNWWGKNYITNKTLNSGDINSNENIRINCSAYLVLNVYETNYKIDNGIVYNVSYVANLKSNNYGEIFNQYFIPNCKIVYNMYCEYLYDNGVVYSGANRIIDLMLSEGSSIKEYRLGFLNNLTVTLDHQNISFFRESSFNAYATIDIFSSAIFNGSNLDINVRVPLVDDVDWFSIVCRYVGNFKSELLLIYNGEVCNTIIIESSFYNEAKNAFSNNFWNALDTYHSCFSGYRNTQICAYAYLYLNDHSLNTIELLDNKLNKSNIQFKLEDVYDLLANNNITLNDILLNLIKNSYSLSDLEMSFINYANGNLFDTLRVSLKYPGNDRSFFAFEDNINKTLMWRGDSSVSLYNIHYVNGGYFDLTAPLPIGDNGDFIYENGNIYSINHNCIYTFLSSDYDCLKTYTFANNKINNNTLNYWLNQKNRTDVNGELYYNIGYMKAAYGSFLEGLLVIYCNDVVADVSADKFNISWTRVNPMVMSVCDSLEGYYLTGESDFNFGREVVGDVNNIKAFNFACSASFSIIEKYVIDALFPNEGNKSSAMFSLIDSFFNNGTLEFIVEGNYTLIRSLNISNVVFVYDETTGILRDCINGCYGAYCYASQQTEWGHNFGENSLNLKDLLDNIINGIDKSLDNIDNDWLGLAGGLAITIGTGLFLASNPVGWGVAIGAGLLIGSGMLATYYADDLNKGWNYNKGAHFIFDVGTSMIPAGAPSSLIKWNVGRLGKIVLSDGHLVRHVTKNSVNKGFDKYLMNLAKSYGGTIDYGSHKIIRYGTIESISNTMYGTTKKEFIEYSIQYCINKYIIGDLVINKIFSR